MPIKEYLDKVCEQIKYKPIRNEISKELENHIEEVKENYLQEGMQEEVAEEKAIMQMGQAKEIGKRLNKIHKPKMNWQLLFLVLILLEFGFLLSYIDKTDRWRVNLIYTILSIIPFVLIYFFDYKKLQKYSNLIYGIATIILLMPSISGDMNTRVVTRMIALPLYIISLAGFIEDIDKESKIRIEHFSININLVKTILLSILSSIIMLQYSRVLMIVLVLTYYAMITSKIIQTRDPKHIKKLFKITGISIIILALMWFGGVAKYNEFDNVIHKFAVSFNPEIDHDMGWVGIGKKEIMKVAEIFGKTEKADINMAMYFNAEKELFPFIALLLNYGWLTSILMIVMVISLSIKLIIDVTKIKDTYGKRLIIGIASSFIIRSLVCILMNSNLIIPLNCGIPFISDNKIELVIDILSLAVIFSVYRRKNIILNLSRESTIGM